MTPSDDVLTPRQAADLLGYKQVKTLYRNNVPFVELSQKKRLFLREDVMAFLKSRRVA